MPVRSSLMEKMCNIVWNFAKQTQWKVNKICTGNLEKNSESLRKAAIAVRTLV